MKIHFEDRGQDFLVWTLDKNGYVKKSEPFQQSIWEGTKVILISIHIKRRPLVVLKEDLENVRVNPREKDFLEQARELNYQVIKITGSKPIPQKKRFVKEERGVKE